MKGSLLEPLAAHPAVCSTVWLDRASVLYRMCVMEGITVPLDRTQEYYRWMLESGRRRKRNDAAATPQSAVRPLDAPEGGGRSDGPMKSSHNSKCDQSSSEPSATMKVLLEAFSEQHKRESSLALSNDLDHRAADVAAPTTKETNETK